MRGTKRETREASPGQQGQASYMRNTGKVKGADKRILNQIIHSTEKVNPRTGKVNPFFDQSQSYDGKVEKELDRIKQKHGL